MAEQPKPRERLGIKRPASNPPADKKPQEVKQGVDDQTTEEWPLGKPPSDVAATIVAPTESTIREIRNRIDEAFNSLGTDRLPGTVIPTGRANNSKEAADYLVADVLKKLADSRLKNASEAADKAGVFGQPDDYVEGDTVMVFSDPHFSINVKLGRPSKMINREAVEAAVAEVIPAAKQQEFLDRCFKPRAATKQIIVSMK